MKLECGKEKLKWALTLTEKVTGKNLSLPVLGYILFQAQKNLLRLRSTNLEIGLEIEIPARVENDGITLINGQVLIHLLNNLHHGDKVNIALVGNNLLVSSPTNSSLLKTYSPADFPPLPNLKSQFVFPVAVEFFLQGLRSVAYSASPSDIKPEISGVYLAGENNVLTFVATDSFRLAEKKITINSVLPQSFQVIIPIKNTNEIIRVLENAGGEVVIGYNEHQLTITSPGLTLVSRLTEGFFPNYHQIVPVSFQTQVVVPQNDLHNALKLAVVFSDRFNQVSIKASVADGVLVVNSQNSDVGENNSRIEAAVHGEDVEISLNVKYFLECFGSIVAESLNLGFNGRGKPVMISGVGDNSFRYLVMPLNR